MEGVAFDIREKQSIEAQVCLRFCISWIIIIIIIIIIVTKTLFERNPEKYVLVYPVLANRMFRKAGRKNIKARR